MSTHGAENADRPVLTPTELLRRVALSPAAKSRRRTRPIPGERRAVGAVSARPAPGGRTNDPPMKTPQPPEVAQHESDSRSTSVPRPKTTSREITADDYDGDVRASKEPTRLNPNQQRAHPCTLGCPRAPACCRRRPADHGTTGNGGRNGPDGRLRTRRHRLACLEATAVLPHGGTTGAGSASRLRPAVRRGGTA